MRVDLSKVRSLIEQTSPNHHRVLSESLVDQTCIVRVTGTDRDDARDTNVGKKEASGNADQKSEVDAVTVRLLQ